MAGLNDEALHDTGINMSCISLPCYTKLKDLPPIQNIQALSVHSVKDMI